MITKQLMTDNQKLYYLLGDNYNKWVCSDSSYYSYITPKIIIDKIIERSKEYFRGLSDKVLWDMFAGIGCDTLRFARHTGKVIASEIKDKTFSDLENNIKDHCNVSIFHEDCCKMIDNITCDIIYFDPPWGQSFHSGEVFDFNDVHLSDGTSVLDLAKKVSIDHHLIIKSPISSTSFEDLLQERVMEVFTFTKQRLKFLIVKAENEIEY